MDQEQRHSEWEGVLHVLFDFSFHLYLTFKATLLPLPTAIWGFLGHRVTLLPLGSETATMGPHFMFPTFELYVSPPACQDLLLPHLDDVTTCLYHGSRDTFSFLSATSIPSRHLMVLSSL
jgi:hypothetical protein